MSIELDHATGETPRTAFSFEELRPDVADDFARLARANGMSAAALIGHNAYVQIRLSSGQVRRAIAAQTQVLASRDYVALTPCNKSANLPRISAALPRPAKRSPRLRQGETGLEKYCSHCDEWWPADHEFFSPGQTAGGLYNYCKACAAEWVACKRAKARAA